MSIEKARAHQVAKPWGRRDLSPWCANAGHSEPVGEVWFERADPALPQPKLLFKLLFTAAPLSIQVHPDDAHARARGLPNGKTEAWYILSADKDARIGLGLKHRVSAGELRTSLADRSIVDLLAWRKPREGEAVLVPAGAIHAIGAGVVLAEVQQRSDATFRLFDHGRQRELHVDEALAVADLGPVDATVEPVVLGTTRTVLVVSPHFVMERVRLPPGSRRRLQPGCEAWVFVLRGSAHAPANDLGIGETYFIADGAAELVADGEGVDLLVAYAAAAPQPGLLHDCEPAATDVERVQRHFSPDELRANRLSGATA